MGYSRIIHSEVETHTLRTRPTVGLQLVVRIAFALSLVLVVSEVK